jgi:hypothetical protein
MYNWKEDLSLMLLTYNDLPGCLATIDTWDKAGIRTPNDIAFINNSSPEYIKAIENRGFRVFYTQVNMGIGYGLKTLIENCKTKYALFLEHDWKCYVDKEEVNRQLLDSMTILDNVYADQYANVVRLRHRTNYGEPLYSLHLKDHILETHPHHLMDADHWCNLLEKYPNQFREVKEITETPFILSDSEFAAYTNNPSLYLTSFLKENIIPWCDGVMNVVENGIQSWWSEQDFTIAKPEGLFTHKPGI